MSTSVSDSERPAISGVAVSFGRHFAASEQFDAIYKEGMALVERAAAYLDGPGRKEARALRGPVSMLYATESMRLTTRLLELASWLMIRRAHKEGEITAEEVRKKRERVRLTAPGRLGHVKGFGELPEGLRKLIEASFALNDRIVRLDRAIEVVVDGPEGAASPVEVQVAQLEQAFAGPRRRAGGPA
jgi:regulator of CtrA degradation